MRIYLESGFDHAWQWDLDHRLILEGIKPGVEVHFSACGSAEAQVLDAYPEDEQVFANVPNILLQDAEDICVYVYVGQVVHTALINVYARPKPADYVYTETEVKRYEALEKRITALEKLGLPSLDASYEGQLLYVVDGVLKPLQLGDGLKIVGGKLTITGAVPDAPEPVVVSELDDDGIMHIYKDGIEIYAAIDDHGVVSWPGMSLSVDADGTLIFEEG